MVVIFEAEINAFFVTFIKLVVATRINLIYVVIAPFSRSKRPTHGHRNRLRMPLQKYIYKRFSTARCDNDCTAAVNQLVTSSPLAACL